jgi:hypothetical protein
VQQKKKKKSTACALRNAVFMESVSINNVCGVIMLLDLLHCGAWMHNDGGGACLSSGITKVN